MRSSHRMVLFKLLLLLGGAAGRVVFDKVERDGDYSGSESSDGNNIMFFEEETDDDDDWWRRRLTHSDGVRRGYATVVDDDLNTVSEFYLRMDVDCGEMVVDDCGGEMLGTICGDRAVVVVGGDAVAFRMELDSRQDERGFSVEGNAVQVGLFLDDCDDEDLVVLSDDMGLANYRADTSGATCSIDLERELGWSEAISFALSEKSATAYVAGREGDSDNRAVAAVKMEKDRCEVLWNTTIGTDSGTPEVFAVNNDDRVEILLTSNEFFARVDRGTSDREGGTVKQLIVKDKLWLPGEGKAIVAYSDAEDAIFSAGIVDGRALLRKSSADNGEALYEIDFTDELDSVDLGTTRDEYDDDDEAFYEWAEKTWLIKGTPEITQVHALGEMVAVVGAYRGELQGRKRVIQRHFNVGVLSTQREKNIQALGSPPRDDRSSKNELD